MKIRHILLLLFINIGLMATTLLTFNTYDRDDRVDLMLSFDTPYNGKIFLKKNANEEIITLSNITFDKKITKNINSDIVQEIQILPEGQNLQIIFKSDKKIGIVASKTTDGFGLRIRATMLKKQNSKIYSAPETTTQQTANYNNQNSYDYNDSRYFLVLLILVALVLLLLYLKRKTSKDFTAGNWLFKPNGSKEDIKILYRKMIDNKNSAVILEYKNIKYLILTGSSNQLLDKFMDDKTISDEDSDEEFEKIFARNREKLDEFLKVGNEKLSSYKDKVGMDASDAIE